MACCGQVVPQKNIRIIDLLLQIDAVPGITIQTKSTSEEGCIPF